MFSLRTLLITVAIAALGTAALVYRTPYWAIAVVTLTLCILGFGLVPVYSHPEKRQFWVPACLTGWLYMVIAFFTPLQLTAYLPTTRLAFEAWYHDDISELLPPSNAPEDEKETLYNLLFSDYAALLGFANDERVNEMRTIWAISHSLTALLIASVCGGLCSWSINRPKSMA